MGQRKSKKQQKSHTSDNSSINKKPQASKSKKAAAKRSPSRLISGPIEIVPIPPWVKQTANGREINILTRPFKEGLTDATEMVIFKNPCIFTVSQELTKRQLDLIKQTVGSHSMGVIKAFLMRVYNVHDVMDLTWTEILSYMEEYLHSQRIRKLEINEQKPTIVNDSQERKEVALRDFIDKNCEIEYSGKKLTKKLNAWKRQIERKAKELIKPSTPGGSGKSHKYYEDELFAVWEHLINKVDSLPPLKNIKS